MEWQEQLQILSQVAIAMGLGALIGFERELAHKPAGLRTHMLVSGAASLLVALGFTIVRRFGASAQYPLVRVDPVVVIQAVVTAVGFLGAGTILRHADGNSSGEHVEGLTTAASLLFVAALGTCVALRQYLLAAGVTALALVTLRLVAIAEARLRRRRVSEPPRP